MVVNSTSSKRRIHGSNYQWLLKKVDCIKDDNTKPGVER